MKSIHEMSKDEINKELCERLGTPWHHITTAFDAPDGWEWSTCTCGDRWFDHAIDRMHRNPDFYSDPGKIQLLREMDEIYGTIVVRKDNRSVSLPASMLLYKDGILAITILNLLRRFDGNS